MKQLDFYGFLPIAGFITAIIWFICIPCHDTLLDVIIFYVAGSCFIFIPLFVFIYSNRSVVD